jgi:hypothetical protein
MLNQDAEKVFTEMETCLSTGFAAMGYDLLEFKRHAPAIRIGSDFLALTRSFKCEYHPALPRLIRLNSEVRNDPPEKERCCLSLVEVDGGSNG